MYENFAVGAMVMFQQFQVSLGDLRGVTTAFIRNGGIRERGVGESLLGKLVSAEKRLSQGKLCAAQTALAAYQKELNAQRGKKITEGAADNLMTYSSYLASLIASSTCRSEFARRPLGSK